MDFTALLSRMVFFPIIDFLSPPMKSVSRAGYRSIFCLSCLFPIPDVFYPSNKSRPINSPVILLLISMCRLNNLLMRPLLLARRLIRHTYQKARVLCAILDIPRLILWPMGRLSSKRDAIVKCRTRPLLLLIVFWSCNPLILLVKAPIDLNRRLLLTLVQFYRIANYRFPISNVKGLTPLSLSPDLSIPIIALNLLGKSKAMNFRILSKYNRSECLCARSSSCPFSASRPNPASVGF